MIVPECAYRGTPFFIGHEQTRAAKPGRIDQLCCAAWHCRWERCPANKSKQAYPLRGIQRVTTIDRLQTSKRVWNEFGTDNGIGSRELS
jgi:hypothetical protein